MSTTIQSLDWRSQEISDKKNVPSRSVKNSFGVACCRFNKTTKSFEILLVKKRYTYSFVAFVFGHYSKRDEKRLYMLFSGMTMQEKIDILSLKFDLMWYKIWMEFPESNLYKNDIPLNVIDIWRYSYKHKANNNYIPHNLNGLSKLDFYIKKKNKFESSFLTDNGKRLRSLVFCTKNSKLLWEIPKGRRNKKETMLDCAIREFKEETTFDVNTYNIMFDIKPVVESFVSLNVTYIHNYYIAYTSKLCTPEINFKSRLQVAEISDIRWIGLNEIKFIDDSGRLYNIISRIFQVFKSRYKHEFQLTCP